jgi:hypothetical protein
LQYVTMTAHLTVSPQPCTETSIDLGQPPHTAETSDSSHRRQEY